MLGWGEEAASRRRGYTAEKPTPQKPSRPAAEYGLHLGRPDSGESKPRREREKQRYHSPRLPCVLLHLDFTSTGHAGRAGRSLTPTAEVISRGGR